MRSDQRELFQARPLSFQRGFTKYAPGSVLVSYGDTRVLCTATIEEKVPPFMRNTQQGWLTAEYSLLPSATHTRANREAAKGKVGGRTHEIQRLIGRSLRSVLDFGHLGERTIQIDADVLQADGGTRTAAISGSMVAMWDAMTWLSKRSVMPHWPIKEFLAAVSVGVVDGKVMCDLTYEEDSTADVDMNVVMTESGRFVELQGTAEGSPFEMSELTDMLQVSGDAISSIIAAMKQELGVL